MFCPNCSNQLNINSTSCSNCGQNIVHHSSHQKMNKKSFFSNKIILIILAIIIIGITFYFGKGYIFKDNKVNDNNQQNNNQSNNNNNNNQIPDNSSVVPSNDAFLFPIEDVFTITGRGTVVTGRVERGNIKVGDEIEIVGLGVKKKAIVSGIEMFRKQLDYAESGDNAGILLKDISKDDVERGQVLAKVNSIGLHTKFKANVYVLKKEESGGLTPFSNNYRPQFYFRTTDVTGRIEVLSKVLSSGDTGDISVELENSIAIEVGDKFSIRDGGRTVGSGTVIEIIK